MGARDAGDYELESGVCLSLADVFGLQAHSDESGGEVSEAGEAEDCAEDEWRFEWAVAIQDVTEHAVGEDLESLSVAYGSFPVVLDSFEVVNCDCV